MDTGAPPRLRESSAASFTRNRQEVEAMTARIDVRRRAAVTFVAMATAAIWLAGGLTASADDPPGNNGTVKVAGEDVNGTDGHVGCTFSVDFYGYDEGDFYGDVVLEALAPTESETLPYSSVFIGEDPSGGGTDADGSVSVDLTGAFTTLPHDTQGYHLKLTVHADGAQGADTKHKTLWSTCDSGEGGGGEENPG
jgi:hypothetical protein